jgi:hypothetical protein
MILQICSSAWWILLGILFIVLWVTSRRHWVFLEETFIWEALKWVSEREGHTEVLDAGLETGRPLQIPHSWGIFPPRNSTCTYAGDEVACDGAFNPNTWGTVPHHPKQSFLWSERRVMGRTWAQIWRSGCLSLNCVALQWTVPMAWWKSPNLSQPPGENVSLGLWEAQVCMEKICYFYYSLPVALTDQSHSLGKHLRRYVERRSSQCVVWIRLWQTIRCRKCTESWGCDKQKEKNETVKGEWWCWATRQKVKPIERGIWQELRLW